MAFCARKLFWAFDQKLCLDPTNMVDTLHRCSQSCSDRGVFKLLYKDCCGKFTCRLQKLDSLCSHCNILLLQLKGEELKNRTRNK